MIYISHRGNITEPKPELENTQAYIEAAIDAGYEVEIDVWLKDGELYLGHDGPEHQTSLEWLDKNINHLWIHTKNFEALSFFMDQDFKMFYHKEEDHTIIGNSNNIWSHNLEEASNKSIIPLLSMTDIDTFELLTSTEVYGICTDYLDYLKIKLT